MAKWGKADYKAMKAFRERLEKMQSENAAAFCEACAKELAARLLALVIKRTPVGDYPSGEGKVGGTLRRGWTAGKNMSAYTYAQSLKVERRGNDYVIEIINPVEYASYVEFGHRQTPGRYVPAIGKRLKRAFVPGKHMMTQSIAELEGIAPGVLQKKLERYLSEVVSGGGD